MTVGVDCYILYLHHYHHNHHILHLLFSTQEFPEIATDTIVHIIRRMSPSQRSDTLRTLNTMDLVSQQSDPVTTPDPQDTSN